MKVIGLFISILVLMSLFVSTGCQTIPQSPKAFVSEENKIGQWEARAFISNLVTKESQVVQLEIINQGATHVRVEVSTGMGFHIASFVIKENQLQYILPKMKVFYDGPLSPQAFHPVLKINLDPRLILSAIANNSYPEWMCQEENGRLSSCSTKTMQKISWEYLDQSPLKKVRITDSKFEVQVAFKTYENKDSINEKTFNLKFPNDYKPIQIN